MALSPAQIYAVARKAGFSTTSAITATAIALAESGGNAGVVNNNPGTGDLSYGLWQINMIGSLGPSRRSQYGLSSNDDLKDPLTNAKVAYALSGGGNNWSPWTTYTRGTYRSYISAATSGAKSGEGLVGTIKGALGNIGGLFTGSTEAKIGGAITGAAESAGEKVVGAIWNTVGAKMLFVTLALGLVGLGAYQTFKPQIRSVTNRAAELGGIAAKAGV
jgi:Lysozyme like domain